MKKSGLWLINVLCAGVILLSCSDGSAKVWQTVASPSGNLHAALLVKFGGATVAETSYVAIFRGSSPAPGDMIPLDDLCYVWRGYRAGIWKITWEGEDRVALAVQAPLPPEYERLIRLGKCEGVSSRWYREERDPSPENRRKSDN